MMNKDNKMTKPQTASVDLQEKRNLWKNQRNGFIAGKYFTYNAI